MVVLLYMIEGSTRIGGIGIGVGIGKMPLYLRWDHHSAMTNVQCPIIMIIQMHFTSQHHQTVLFFIIQHFTIKKRVKDYARAVCTGGHLLICSAFLT